MAHDADYFRRRAAEARAAAFHREEGEGVEVAGQLALAYAALARRRATSVTAVDDRAPPVASEAGDPAPMMLRD